MWRHCVIVSVLAVGVMAGGVRADHDYGDYFAKHYQDGKHAVWFSNGLDYFGSAGSSHRYHFTNHQGHFSYDADSAVLDGVIENGDGTKLFNFHFEFTTEGLLDLNDINPKLGGTSQDANWARQNWDFYNLDADNSYITPLVADGITVELKQKPSDFSKPLQVGWGANDKDGDFGASSWFAYRLNYGQGEYSRWKQGDINIDLAHVPAPGAALLAMMGMSATGWVRRRFS